MSKQSCIDIINKKIEFLNDSDVDSFVHTKAQLLSGYNRMKDELTKFEDYKKKLKEWIKFRTDAISEMFDNVNEHGIYPTTEFFMKIDNFFKDTLIQIQINLPTDESQ